MSDTFKSKKFKSLVPYFLFAIAVILAYKLISEAGFFFGVVSGIWNIVTPFFYGFLLAYIINIPFGGIQMLLKKSKNALIIKRKKMIGAILTFIFFALMVFLTLNLVIPYVYRIISFFIANLPAYYERVLYYIDYLNRLEAFGIHISKESIMTGLQEMLQGLSLDNVSSSLNAIFGFSTAVFTGFLAFISSIYILVEKEKIKAFLCKLLAVFTPDKICNGTIGYARRLNSNFKQYIYMQTIDGLILGTVVTIELLIMRSPYALILGIMLGVVNYIPYFGSIIGTAVVIIIVAFTQGIPMAAIATVVLLITQQLDANVIQPRLLGGSFSLSPFLVIISISIGGAAAGVLGMIAAIPILAVLKDMFESIIVYYEKKKADKSGDSC